jgi:hypothetical protein
MIPVNQFEEFLKEIEQELSILKTKTPADVMSLVEKEAKEAIRAERVHEQASDSIPKEVSERREYAVEKLKKWIEDPTLAEKFLKDEIALKEKMRIAAQAEIAKAQAVKV